MKRFKKKHTKIPSQETIVRLLARTNRTLAHKYIARLENTPEIIPQPIREACLAEFDPGRRSNIRYFPDLHNFQLHEQPNRSLPVPKFLALFQQFINPQELKNLEEAMTAYRLVFHTTPEKWLEVYRDETVHSCMSNDPLVRCYAHPGNKLALAALYPPGGSYVVARSIVNTDEKWYVRLYGDALLVDKLHALGYNRLTKAPKAFRMYGVAGPIYSPSNIRFPYFDIPLASSIPISDTHDSTTGLVEVIINQGINT